MEHLRLSPTTPLVSIEFAVQLYCDFRELGSPTGGGQNFHSFPADKGWLVDSAGEFKTRHCIRTGECEHEGTRSAPCKRDACYTTPTKDEWSAFTQKWLFFEVLREFFSSVPGFRYDDFVLSKGHEQLVHTSELNSLLSKWSTVQKTATKHAREHHLVRLHGVLTRARYFVLNFCSDNSTLGTRISWDVDEYVALSFMTLGETLSRALVKFREKNNLSFRGWLDETANLSGWGYSVVVDQYLRDNQWCQRAMTNLRATSKDSSIGLLLAADFFPRSERGAHVLCTPNHCKLRQGGSPSKIRPFDRLNQVTKQLKEEKLKTTRPQHWKKGCECQFIGCKTDKIVSYITDTSFPLLWYDGKKNKIKIIKVDSWKKYNYTVFSHVWSDGFGNEEKNEMYKCVIGNLVTLLEEVRKRSVTAQNDADHAPSEYFWIDTLALPIRKENARSEEARRKGIAKIHEIYRHAKYTIVIDRGLVQGKLFEAGVAGIRISLSKWMTRLWTLQEGVLSVNLLFAFPSRRKLYTLEEIDEDLESADVSLHRTVSAVSRMYYDGLLGEERSLLADVKDKSPIASPKLVAALWRAVQWRSTTKPRDETLALAIILGLKTDAFVETRYISPDERTSPTELADLMVKLITLLGQQKSPGEFNWFEGESSAIPGGMVFLGGDKLSRPGYRWAPWTWLSDQAILTPDPLTIHHGPTHLRIDSSRHSGLEVWFPGFYLHDLVARESWFGNASGFRFPINGGLHEWYNVTLPLPFKEELSVKQEGDEEKGTGREEKGNIEHKSETFWEQPGKKRDLAIIAMRLPLLEENEIALLVAIQNTSHLAKANPNRNHNYLYGEPVDCFDVVILDRVLLSRETNHGRIEMAQKEFRQNPPGHELFAAEQLHLQKWCVDGHSDRVKPREPSPKPRKTKTFAENATPDPKPFARADTVFE